MASHDEVVTCESLLFKFFDSVADVMIDKDWFRSIKNEIR
jgi:hypothetical protein